MMSGRVLVLTTADRETLGSVRHLPGLQAAETGGQLWVGGLPTTGELPMPVRGLAAVAIYGLDTEGRLFASGQRTPTARLPAGLVWQPIRAFLPLELPTAAMPAQHPSSYRVRLCPSARAEAAAGLLTTLAAWHAYAETAPEIRLRCLHFAVADDARVLLLGTPLPPLPGQELWLSEGLLLPAGFDFEAPLLAPLLRQKLESAPDDMLLFAADSSWERVPNAAVLPVTRSAVRLTWEEFER
ncbi:hypothetical protein [Hymenobacter lapidiphilus]|uniref:MoxR-vWA-beta-propeller ternary system domain-containing protein n=1 Tax=Hymenobacter lapidiphilus TaxID=2608003 RepID=A0A7Y7PS92_9BACT|nr:hypothetical protein [Hymenobacter lapidiphilus]NVO33093.1 hypothetical protein [Hymenobacter lapidiphilus]